MSTDPAVYGETGMPKDGVMVCSFGVALAALKNGKSLWRERWNRNTIRVKMIAVPLLGDDVQHIPGMFDEDDKFLGFWHPSPTDLLAEDWHFE